MDPQMTGDAYKQVIGAVLQSTALPEKIRVSEALNMFASFYDKGRETGALLKRFGLEEKRNAFYGTLSGGQKQRLALAVALVNEPRVVFLDEPTAGLDPQVRREIYDVIEELRKEKKTLLLTTHYIEEAERLCDRVAIVDQGQVIAHGTPRELKARSAGTTRIELRLARPETNEALLRLERERVGLSGTSDGMRYVLRSARVPQTIVSLVKYLEAQGNELASLEISARHRTGGCVPGIDGTEAAGLKNALALTKMRMRLALRNRAFLFFSLIIPMVFLFLFLGLFARAERT